jgi:spectinomycin phosphotransferase
MPMGSSLTPKQIIEALRAVYGMEVITLTFFPRGADLNSVVYKADTKDKCYFVKLKHSYDHDESHAIASLLEKAQVQQILLPIKTLQGRQTQHIEDWTILVFPFIEGEDGLSRELTHQQWITLGKALRQIHEIEVPIPLQKQLRKETYSDRWCKAVKWLFKHCDVVPDDGEIALNMLKFMKGNKATIDRLVRRAELLGEQLKKQTVRFVFCHADIHGGNVLIDQRGHLYIIDWDYPIMAPKERDLMFIGGGVANRWNRPHEKEYFYQGYGTTDIDRTILTYYRYERIVEDIALYCQELMFAVGKDGDKPKKYQQFIDMFIPNGVVDIAFKTDKDLKF